jgi:hypothetical protein
MSTGWGKQKLGRLYQTRAPTAPARENAANNRLVMRTPFTGELTAPGSYHSKG